MAGVRPPRAWLGLLEAAANRLLQADPDIAPRLQRLQGRVLQLTISGLGVQLYALVSDGSVVFFADFGGEADVHLTAPPLALARMAWQRRHGLDGRADDVQMSGDMQAARQFQQLLASLDVDWEELLAQRVGDVLARQAGLLAEGLKHWLQRSQTTLDMAVRDYIQEEARHSPTAIEMRNLGDDVDELRMAVDRLDARLRRLRQSN